MPVRTQSYAIAGRQIELTLPADPEQVLHDAVASEASGLPGSDPYWGVLWPTAERMAELILQKFSPPRLKALDLGCGVGLTGIAGLLAGHHVSFSDRSARAVQLAQANAAGNGFADVPGLVFEWQDPPGLQFDFLFASDVLYDTGGHGPLLRTLRTMLLPEGTIWIGDPGRNDAQLFIKQARSEGWQVALCDDRFQPLEDAEHLQFRLIVMTRREEAGGVLSAPEAISRALADPSKR